MYRIKLSGDDIDIESEFKILDKAEVAYEKRDNIIFSDYLKGIGIDVEGVVDFIKDMIVRLKKLLSKMGTQAKRIWLRALIFFGENDKLLSGHKSKISGLLVLDIKNKGEVKDELKSFVLEQAYGFMSSKEVTGSSTSLEAVFYNGEHDRYTPTDLIKIIPSPDQKLTDYLVGKSDIGFVRFQKDNISFIVRSKVSEQDDGYIKLVKSPVTRTVYNKLETDMLYNIDNNRMLEPLRALFKSVLSYDDLKDTISTSFKKLSDYEDMARKIESDADTSSKKLRLEYDTLKAHSLATYAGMRAEIRKTKLAIRLGRILFEE